MVKIEQFLVVSRTVVKIKQFLVAIWTVVKIKQFLVVGMTLQTQLSGKLVQFLF